MNTGMQLKAKVPDFKIILLRWRDPGSLIKNPMKTQVRFEKQW